MKNKTNSRIESPCSRQSLTQGTKIGVYEINQLVESDYLSLSYSAWNHHLQEPVLIREFFPSKLAMRSVDGIGLESLADLENERYAVGLSAFLSGGERLADIDHKAVSKVLHVLESNYTGYQIQSFEPGLRLSSWINSGYTFKRDELRVIFETLLDGLEVVHKSGLMHGVICPKNIELRNDGVPLLTNFLGELLKFARDEDALPEILPKAYASAESYLQDYNFDPLDDVYALGATLYHCDTKQVPPPASYRLKQLRNGNKDPLSSLASSSESDPSVAWMKAIDWMLSLESRRRPQNVSEIATFLKILEDESKKRERVTTIGKIRSIRFPAPMSGIRFRAAAPLVFAFTVVILFIRYFEFADFVDRDDVGIGNRRVESQATYRTTTVGLVTQDSEFERIDPKPNSTSITAIQSRSGFTARNHQSQTNSIATERREANAKSPTAESASLDLHEVELRKIARRAPEQLAALNRRPMMPKVSYLNQSSPRKTHEADYLASVIAGHLAAAETNLSKFNLTIPAEDNAYQNYENVLRLDPTNQKALYGINRILEVSAWCIIPEPKRKNKRGRIK